MKELYQTVTLSSGEEIPESQLSEFHARNKAAQETYFKAAKEKASRRLLLPSCPFSSAIDTTCDENCALHVDGGCSLAKLIKGTPAATEGKRCPITRNLCNKKCALHENGCKLTAI